MDAGPLVRGVAGRQATVFIDTSVLLQVFSHGDLYRAFQRGDDADLDRRFQQSRHALWMSMALCEQIAVTVNYSDETLNVMLGLAPPQSEVGAWTSAILHVLVEGGVFDGWTRLSTIAGEHLTRPAGPDIRIVELCRDHGLAVITRDDGLFRRAEREGVRAYYPGAYAAEVIPFEQARAIYIDRLVRALQRYRTAPTTDLAPTQVAELHESLALIEEFQRSLWED